jgi:hypothetical protein
MINALDQNQVDADRSMNSEQRAVYEQVEHDLRMALKSLLEPYMNEVACIGDVRERVQAAHEIIERVLLERMAGMEQPDPVVDRILRKIAQDSK